jgi:hypothetical protein
MLTYADVQAFFDKSASVAAKEAVLRTAVKKHVSTCTCCVPVKQVK